MYLADCVELMRLIPAGRLRALQEAFLLILRSGPSAGVERAIHAYAYQVPDEDVLR